MTEPSTPYFSEQSLRRGISGDALTLTLSLRNALVAAGWTLQATTPSVNRYWCQFPKELAAPPAPGFVKWDLPVFNGMPAPLPVMNHFQDNYFGWNLYGKQFAWYDDRFYNTPEGGVCANGWVPLGATAEESLTNYLATFGCYGLHLTTVDGEDSRYPGLGYYYYVIASASGDILYDNIDIVAPFGGSDYTARSGNGGYLLQSQDGAVQVQLIHGQVMGAENADYPSHWNLSGVGANTLHVLIVKVISNGGSVWYQLGAGTYDVIACPNQFVMAASGEGNNFLLVSSLCQDDERAPVTPAIFSLGERIYAGVSIQLIPSNIDGNTTEDMPQTYLGWDHGVACSVDGAPLISTQFSNAPNANYRFPTLLPWTLRDVPVLALNGQPVASRPFVAMTNIHEASAYSKIVGALWDAKCVSSGHSGSTEGQDSDGRSWVLVSRSLLPGMANASLWFCYDE